MNSAIAENQELEAAVDHNKAIIEPTLNTKGTYSQILKSSTLVGGSSLLNIAIGIGRMKIMAILLGPGGVGLLSVYASIVSLLQTFAGMGINSSGVRQIALANSNHDKHSISLTIGVLRRTALFLGAFGGLTLVLFSKKISSITFGNQEHASAISALAIAVFLALVGAGQSALLQGLQRIADLAKTSVIGALLGTVFSIPLIYQFRKSAIVPSLIGIAGMSALTSWWFSRNVMTRFTDTPVQSVIAEVGALIKLGIAFMTSSLMTLGVAYVIRITILRKLGIEAAGLYQSAWTLGGLYVGFILQAMGADFYPRLTVSINDNITSNRLVNEQTQIGILLGAPGVLATLTLAPSVISLFYTAKFEPAVGILRWICLGTIIQVISWPLGFIVIAKAKKILFIVCESAWAIVSLSLAWFCIGRYGLIGTGITFFGSYIFHATLLYTIVNRLTGFKWSKQNRLSGFALLLTIAIVFLSSCFLHSVEAEIIGAVATIACGVYSLRTIKNLLTFEELPVSIKNILNLLRNSSSLFNEQTRGS